MSGSPSQVTPAFPVPQCLYLLSFGSFNEPAESSQIGNQTVNLVPVWSDIFGPSSLINHWPAGALAAPGVTPMPAPITGSLS